MTCPIANASRYLTMADEGTWATVPGSPSYWHLPVFRYDVRPQPNLRNAMPFLGIFDPKHQRIVSEYVSGNMQAALYGWIPSGQTESLAQKLVDWGFADYSGACGPSKLAEWTVDGDTDNRRHLGLRVDTAVLKGSDSQQYVDISLSLAGMKETVPDSKQAIPDDTNKLIEFEYQNVSFYIGADSGSLTNTPIQAFGLQRQNHLKPYFMNSNYPTYLCRTGPTALNLSVVPLKLTNTYDGYIRALGETDLYGRIVLKGLHNGTGTGGTNYTVITIDLPRMALANKTDSDDDLNGVTFETLNFNCLKPDSSTARINIAYTEE